MQKKHVAAPMGIKQDIKDSLKKFKITKIGGQPTDKDMNKTHT